MEPTESKYFLIVVIAVAVLVVGGSYVNLFAQELPAGTDQQAVTLDVEDVPSDPFLRDEFKKERLTPQEISAETLRQLQVMNATLMRIEAKL